MTRHNENHPHTGPRQDNADYWVDIFGDVDFPIHRAGLWNHARKRKADPLLLNNLKNMPERSYKSIEEFRQIFSAQLENYGNLH